MILKPPLENKSMNQHKWLRLLGVVSGVILIVAGLTFGNLLTRSIPVNSATILDLHTSGDNLSLLMPDWEIDPADPTHFRTTFTITGTDGLAGLYIPRADNVELFINHSSDRVIQDDAHLIFWFTDQDINHPLTIDLTLPPANNQTYSAAQIYVGSFQAIMRASHRESILRIFIVGLSFTIILFSASLFLQKTSEKYLLPLAFMVYSTLGYILLNTFPDLQNIGWINFMLLGAIKLPFLTKEVSLQIYSIVFPLFVGLLNYLLLRNFVSVKIGRINYFYLILPVSIAMLGFINQPIFPYFPLVYRVYINILECIVIVKGIYKFRSDLLILLAGCTGTIGISLFITGCGIGLIPHGNMDLLFKLGGVSASFYAIAFTAAINGIFARKYTEAEVLAGQLEDINKNLQKVVSERTAELEIAYLRLEAEQKQKDVFVSNMMHSLKTPLFSAAGYADMAQEALKTIPDQAGHFIDLVNTNIDYVVKLVNNLFIALRLENHQVNFMVEKVSLSKVLRQVYDTSLIQTQQKGIHLLVDQPSGPVLIDCDPHYLTIAIQNIVDNAIRHTASAGSIWLSLIEMENWITISVRDNGEGMTETVKSHVFERYYSHTGTGNSSSGIGLTISNDIIHAFNGTISVTSEIDSGTEFIITLPTDLDIKNLSDTM
jgi:two-component system phosphate regulon sensor histidine kinase PhoR